MIKEELSMNDIKIFCYKNYEVRTIEKDGVTWWVLKDVCGVLNIENHKDLPKRLEEDEVGRFELPTHKAKVKCLKWFVSTKVVCTA